MAHDDHLSGTDGNNVFRPGAGDDTIDGRDGTDTVTYSDDMQGVTVNLAAATNQASGPGIGTDQLISIEKVIGSQGDDRLTGNAAANELSGRDGDDVLIGEAGDNVLTGGLRSDFLTGDAGADIFDFNSIEESPTGATRDRIQDFNRGQGDRIDLSDIDANTKKSGHQNFKFIGRDDFSKTAGELHYVKKSTYVLVEGDLNGDGKADFQIKVKGISNLDEGNFIL